MREAEAILSAYEQVKQKEGRCVLATVVHVSGSAYRRAGARMLVEENGQMVGAISGGCLEGDALRKALHALHQNENKLITYDTSDEEDAVIGAQLGCNGVIQVLFEPINPNQANNPIELLRRGVVAEQPMVLISCFRLEESGGQIGTILLLDEQLQVVGTTKPPPQLAAFQEASRTALAQGRSQFREYQNGASREQAFFELLLPPPQLVLVGAGNDAQVLAQMAEVLGWRITIADGRPSHASTKRFTGSCQVVVAKPEQLLAHLTINDRTAFVLMTHNYNYDLAVLKHLLDYENLPYIGMLGPKKKYQRMLDELADAGIHLSDKQRARIYAPVGLALGAETPAEIGLSVLAEIQRVFTESDGQSLRDREGPIHKHRQSQFQVVQL